MTTQQAPPGRHDLFDHYWQTRDYSSADARTRQRTAYCRRMLQNSRGRLLDVGCGRGYTSVYFARRGFDVLGIDVSPIAVEWTRELGLDARVIDLENDPVDGSFDVIVCLETLQYVRDPVQALTKLKHALTDKGELIVSLPNERHLARRLMRKAPNENRYVRTSLRPAEHRRLIEDAGLKITAVRPISLVPPRWGALNVPGHISARLFPSLFALSVMYRLVEGNKG